MVKGMPARNNRRLTIVMCILSVVSMLIALFPVNYALAADKPLTLICRRDDITLVGMQWRLYRVGERKNGDFVLTGQFKDYPVYLKDMSESAVASAAKTLESFAVADGIAPLASGKTDKTGELTFHGLDNGLYLATGKILQVGSVFYVPSSLLIEVQDNNTSFSYDAYPKFYFATLSDETKTYKVKKVWVDNDDAYLARPVNVTVDLFCDGELRDTVVLSEENNWEYQWLDLDPLAEWRVAERKIPVKYGVVIDFNETQYLIKNSYGKTPIIDNGEEIRTTAPPVTTLFDDERTTDAIPPTTIAGGSVTTAAEPPSATMGKTPDVTTIGGQSRTTVRTPTSTTTAVSGGLIKTGQMWWQVIVLAAGGLLLVIIGIMLKPKKDR